MDIILSEVHGKKERPICMAAGGMFKLSAKMLVTLRHNNTYLFPDYNKKAIDFWFEKAKQSKTNASITRWWLHFDKPNDGDDIIDCIEKMGVLKYKELLKNK